MPIHNIEAYQQAVHQDLGIPNYPIIAGSPHTRRSGLEYHAARAVPHSHQAMRNQVWNKHRYERPAAGCIPVPWFTARTASTKQLEHTFLYTQQASSCIPVVALYEPGSGDDPRIGLFHAGELDRSVNPKWFSGIMDHSPKRHILLLNASRFGWNNLNSPLQGTGILSYYLETKRNFPAPDEPDMHVIDIWVGQKVAPEKHIPLTGIDVLIGPDDWGNLGLTVWPTLMQSECAYAAMITPDNQIVEYEG